MRPLRTTQLNAQSLRNGRPVLRSSWRKRLGVERLAERREERAHPVAAGGAAVWLTDLPRAASHRDDLCVLVERVDGPLEITLAERREDCRTNAPRRPARRASFGDTPSARSTANWRARPTSGGKRSSRARPAPSSPPTACSRSSRRCARRWARDPPLPARGHASRAAPGAARPRVRAARRVARLPPRPSDLQLRRRGAPLRGPGPRLTVELRTLRYRKATSVACRADRLPDSPS